MYVLAICGADRAPEDEGDDVMTSGGAMPPDMGNGAAHTGVVPRRDRRHDGKRLRRRRQQDEEGGYRLLIRALMFRCVVVCVVSLLEWIV